MITGARLRTIARLGVLSLALCALGAAPPDAGTAPASAPTSTITAPDPAVLAAKKRAAEAEAARLDAIAREYERIAGDGADDDKPKNVVATQTSDGSTLVTAFLKMVFALGGIVLLAYLLLGKVLPKVMKIEPPAAQRRIMTVVDRLPIDQRRSIMILKIGGSHYLVGASEQTISLLSKLDDEEIERALSTSAPSSPGSGRLTSVFARKSDKTS
ncbi:flagellar biosynthetic protein FliO [Myxococcota bacterium]|nr:flagellar biosynthetic protein FliO [Myxococcota bacterium]